MTSFKLYFKWAFFTLSIVFLQFIFPLNVAITLLVACFSAAMIYKQSALFIIPFLVLSFYHGDSSISIYTLKLSGLSLSYILVLFFTVFVCIRDNRLDKGAIYFLLIILILCIYSIFLGNAAYTNYFISDVVYLIISFCFIILLKQCRSVNYDLLFLSLGTGYFLAKVLVIITGIGLESVDYSRDVSQLNAIFDPVENFLVVYAINAFFYPDTRKSRVAASVNILVFSIAIFLLGYMHGGTIILILGSVLYCLLRSLKYLTMISLILIPLITSYTISINLEKDSVLYYKVEKVVGLVQFIFNSDLSVYDLPRSTQVRVIETMNILHQNPAFVFFGKGLGGHITETRYQYGSYLNSDDYSQFEVSERKFFTLHTYNQILLKHGVIGLLFLFYLWKRARSFKNKNLVDAILIFLVFSYAFTIKPYIFLAIFVSEAFKTPSISKSAAR